MGKLWVKGVVAGAEVGGSAYGGEYRGWFLVFSMGWLGSWFLDRGSGGPVSIRVEFFPDFEKNFFVSRFWCAQVSSPMKCL